jgi:hypothetical protein
MCHVAIRLGEVDRFFDNVAQRASASAFGNRKRQHAEAGLPQQTERLMRMRPVGVSRADAPRAITS